MQVWHFRDAPATFQGFVDPGQRMAFQQRMDRLKPITQPNRENVTMANGTIVVM